MQLYFRRYGEEQHEAAPVVLLHGLLGSSMNWHSVAKELAEHFPIWVPDLRNHGRSPHDDDASYPAMAQDVLEMMDGANIDSAILLGHSMGAKVAMWIALNFGQRVEKLVSVDMAPVSYTHDFAEIVEALQNLNLDFIKSRTDADQSLARALESPPLRGYLLQNLIKEDDTWAWRMNLSALAQSQQIIAGFPEQVESAQYQGQTLFIYGAASDYVLAEHQEKIKQLFPYSRTRSIAGAGHWVYAEKPEAFLQALKGFLLSADGLPAF